MEGLRFLHPELAKAPFKTWSDVPTTGFAVERDGGIRIARLEDAGTAHLVSEGATFFHPLRSDEVVPMLERVDAINALPPPLRPLFVFLPEQSPPGHRYPSCWQGVLPDAEPSRLLVASVRRLVQSTRPDRFLRHLMVENWALAGLDVFRTARLATTQRSPSATKQRALIVAIEGIDGSGKTTHADEIVRRLEARGIPVAKRRIYRHGVFHETVTELTRRCAFERRLDLWRLQRLIKLFDSVKVRFGALDGDLERDMVLVFDRYIPTHLAAGRGRFHHDPFAREMMSVFPSADVSVLLDAPVERSLARLADREERTVDENPYMLRRYRELLLALAARQKTSVLDALSPFEENAAAIEDAVLAAWETRECR